MNAIIDKLKQFYGNQNEANEINDRKELILKENINDNCSKEKVIKEEIRQLANQLNKKKDSKIENNDKETREYEEMSKYSTNENLPLNKFSCLISNYRSLKYYMD